MAKEQKSTYFVVIENLKLSRKLRLGQVELEPLTSKKVDELIDKVNIGLDREAQYWDEEKDRVTFKQLHRHPVLSHFNSNETNQPGYQSFQILGNVIKTRYKNKRNNSCKNKPIPKCKG